MTSEATTVEAEALEWIIRLHDPGFVEWDALSAWLAADPRRAAIFQELALLDDQLAADLAGELTGRK
jgi:transmembrane sensor